MLRRITMLFSAVLLLITTAWALPAQAVGVYSRAFTNVFHSDQDNRSMCLWTEDNRADDHSPYLKSCASSPNSLAKWWLHQKVDNFGGTGNPMWVLQSQGTSSTSCLEAHPNASLSYNLSLGTCNWAGGGSDINKQWEAIKQANGAWVIRSVSAKQYNKNLCIGAFGGTAIAVLLQECTFGAKQQWNAGNATPVS
ncbi:hypothetical protein ACFY36_31785 [Actinoplanes sp. NPDC000266]